MLVQPSSHCPLAAAPTATKTHRSTPSSCFICRFVKRGPRNVGTSAGYVGETKTSDMCEHGRGKHLFLLSWGKSHWLVHHPSPPFRISSDLVPHHYPSTSALIFCFIPVRMSQMFKKTKENPFPELQITIPPVHAVQTTRRQKLKC